MIRAGQESMMEKSECPLGLEPETVSGCWAAAKRPENGGFRKRRDQDALTE
jgi:hypothetical protein